MPLVLGIFFTLVIGLFASVYVWNFRRRHAEMAAGLTALAAMRWRDFAALVVRMLTESGYTPLELHPLGSGDQPDFVMRRDGVLCVVSCKHGSTYHLDAADLKQLGDSIRMHDAASGKMVTAGQFTSDAQAAAATLRIELIDGAMLWPRVAPLIPAAQLQHLQSIASANARRQIGVAWLLAVMLGVAIALLMPRSANESMDVAMPAPTPDVPVPKVVAEASQSPAAVPDQAPVPVSVPAPAESRPPLPTLPQSESLQRQNALGAIAALPGVERALWSTQSTLLVFLLGDTEQTWPGICRVLERYPEVRAVRVQLTPPPGSASPIRFRQCQAY